MNTCLFYNLIILMLCSCSGKTPGTIPDIIVDKSRFSRYDVIESLPSTAEKIGLSRIDNGVDSFTYRFWYPIDGDSADGFTVIDISYMNNKWRAVQLDFWGHIPEYEFKRGDKTNYFLQFIVDSARKRELFSKDKLDVVVAQISKLNLQNGPSQNALDSNDYDSEFSRYLEFANSYKYRAIHIGCKSKKNQTSFNQKVMELERLLKKQFNCNIKQCIEFDYRIESLDSTTSHNMGLPQA